MFYTHSGRSFTVTTSETNLGTFLQKLNLPNFLCRKITAEDASPSGMVIKLIAYSIEDVKKLEELLKNYPKES